MHDVPPAPEELAALLRLLDDDTPEVRERVAQRLALCGGDLSEFLSTHPRALSATEKCVLTDMLSPARRMSLERDWQVPTGGTAALRDDWDALEALLRVISDFLHDGLTIRQALSDGLDLLAEDAAEAGVMNARDLGKFLFEEQRLVGNDEVYDDPRNSDIAWAIAEGKSNPLGLVVIFVTVARRLDLVVEPVNFPGHFLCRIYEDGYPIIIDCFDQGRMHLQSTLLEDPDIGRDERKTLVETADTGMVLLRLLNNLVHALETAGRKVDARLIRKLRATLK